MKHAREDYNRIQDPENKIPADEPVFLLRAQDTLAPGIVEAWARAAQKAGASGEIVGRAIAHSAAMKDWQMVNGSKTPDL